MSRFFDEHCDNEAAQRKRDRRQWIPASSEKNQCQCPSIGDLA